MDFLWAGATPTEPPPCFFGAASPAYHPLVGCSRFLRSKKQMVSKHLVLSRCKHSASTPQCLRGLLLLLLAAHLRQQRRRPRRHAEVSRPAIFANRLSATRMLLRLQATVAGTIALVAGSGVEAERQRAPSVAEAGCLAVPKATLATGCICN